MSKFFKGQRVKVTLRQGKDKPEIVYGEFLRMHKNPEFCFINPYRPDQKRMTVKLDWVQESSVASYDTGDIYSGELEHLKEDIFDVEHIWTGETFEDAGEQEVSFDDLLKDVKNSAEAIELMKQVGAWEKYEELCEKSMEGDSDIYTFAWEDFKENLQDLMKEKMEKWGSSSWYVAGRNLDWRNSSGYAQFDTDTSEELLRKILPDTDCTIRVYDRQSYLAFSVAHHDCPMGSSIDVYVLEEFIDQNFKTKELGDIIRKYNKDYQDDLYPYEIGKAKKPKVGIVKEIINEVGFEYVTEE